ncbi:hypothetical protein [uncultured Clostridium sp.]|uniref:hypothetical protein n=1 Tax=uncultured Clostridium sp. TaxID=59620 RepID=UPI0025FE2551|nr:hypothetical protein [uncultured Clostridium sp.]
MKDIKEYLENQLKLSEELNTILKEIDLLDNKERELHYKENKELREKLDKANAENIKAAGDRITFLKKKSMIC